MNRMSSSDFDDLSLHCGLDDVKSQPHGIKSSFLGSSFTVLFSNLTGYKSEKTKQGHLLGRDDEGVELGPFTN